MDSLCPSSPDDHGFTMKGDFFVLHRSQYRGPDVTKPVTLMHHTNGFGLVISHRKETTDLTMADNTFTSFGAFLKTLRKRAHLAQQELAQAIGVHRRTLVRWEQGDYLPESKAIVLELARCLKLDAQETRQLLEASLIALAPYFLVSLPRNLFFTGREEILEVLHAQLGVERTVALMQSSALYGLGGVGKTQIALEYAYRHALEYSAVFWIGAETEEQAITSFLRIAEVLELPERADNDQQRMIAAVQRWLSTHGRWLLIWDNMEDLEILDRFLPSTRSGAILITTRRQALGTLARGIDLEPMRLEEGILFVLRRIKVLEPEATQEDVQTFAVRMPGEYTAATELVMAMGALPLALDQAGAYIEETGCGFASYLQYYRQQRARLLARRGGSGYNHPQSVTTTFSLVMERLEREQRTAAHLLCACALLYAEAIPEEIFRRGAVHLGPELEPLASDPSLLDQTLVALRGFSLVHRHSETQTLSLHRLVQAVLRERMSKQEQETWLKRVVVALDAVLPEVSHEARDQCGRLLPHVLAVVAAIPDQGADRELVEVLRKTADYLRERAQYELAESLYQRALRLLEQAFGPEHLEVASFLDRLAIVFFRQGKYEQAERLYQRALHTWERALGPEHLRVAGPLYGLARLNLRRGKYEQAELLYQRALCIWEQALGPEHPEIAKTLDGLAILYGKQGKYKQAEPLCQRALHIWERAFGPEHPLVAHALAALAELSDGQGKYEQAESLYQQALRIWERALGPEHPEVAFPLESLADLFSRQGRYAQAESLYQQALRIWEHALGPEHPERAYPLNGLANLYRSQGKHEEAETLYEQALRLREHFLGPEHPETANTLYDLAVFRKTQGHLSEALSLARRALQSYIQFLGEAHPKTVATQMLSAQLAQGQADDAEPTLEHIRTALKERGWSVHLKKRRDKPYVYATRKVGQHTQSRYLAPLSDPAACLAAARALPNAKEK
jgi:tetratricopeptide (TPR) repeat protein